MYAGEKRKDSNGVEEGGEKSKALRAEKKNQRLKEDGRLIVVLLLWNSLTRAVDEWISTSTIPSCSNALKPKIQLYPPYRFGSLLASDDPRDQIQGYSVDQRDFLLLGR